MCLTLDLTVPICNWEIYFYNMFNRHPKKGKNVYSLFLLDGPISANQIACSEPVRQADTCFWSFSGVHNYGPKHLDEAVAFLARTCKKYPYEELFSEPFKLTDFETALELSKQQTFYRVCMKPWVYRGFTKINMTFLGYVHTCCLSTVPECHSCMVLMWTHLFPKQSYDCLQARNDICVLGVPSTWTQHHFVPVPK